MDEEGVVLQEYKALSEPKALDEALSAAAASWV